MDFILLVWVVCCGDLVISLIFWYITLRCWFWVYCGGFVLGLVICCLGLFVVWGLFVVVGCGLVDALMIVDCLYCYYELYFMLVITNCWVVFCYTLGGCFVFVV